MKRNPLLFLLLFALIAPWAANAQQTLPYMEGFEDYGSGLPTGWTKVGSGTVTVTSPTAQLVHNGSKSLKFSGATSNVVALPQFTEETNTLQITLFTTPELSYNGNPYNSCKDFDIGYVTDLTDANTFVALATYNQADFPNGYLEKGPVSMETAPDGAYIAFRHRPSSPSYYWFVDDITVEAIPSCRQPILGEAQYITEEGASFQWTENGSAQDWVLQYSMYSDFTNATSVDRHGIPALAITGLNSGVTYYVRLKSVCGGGDESAWSNVVSFTTTAVATEVGNFWYDYFDDTTCGWNLINGTQTNKWTWGSAVHNLGTHALYISNDGGITNAYTNSSTSVVYATKLFHFTEGRFEFYYTWRAQGESNYDYLRAWLAPATATFTSGQLPNGTTNMNGYVNTTPEGWIALGGKLNQVDTWQIKTVATDVAAGDYYMVFMWGNDFSEGTQPPAAIGNVRITHLTCPYDVEDLAVNNVTSTSASLSWTESEATQWQMVIKFDDIWFDFEDYFTTNTPTLTNLRPSTDYQVMVRACCSDSDFGAWSDIISFTTSEGCLAPTDVQVTATTAHGFTASFTPGSPEQTTWYYSLTTAPDVQPDWFMQIYNITDNSFEIQNGNSYIDIQPETTYYLWVGIYCEDEWTMGEPVEFTTLAVCPVPTDVEVSNITHNSATVTWNGYNDFYHVQWGRNETIVTLVDEDFDTSIPSDWINSTEYPWTIVNGHMQSGNAGQNSSTSSISVTKTFSGNGTVQFDAECMGEGTGTYAWDKCIFSIDGEEQFVYGAHVSGWNHYSFDVTIGEHTFTWSYTKDASVAALGDYFAVDNVVMITHEIYWNEIEDIIVFDGQSANLTGLNSNTLYYVRVQGVCNDVDFLKDGGGSWSGDELGIHTDWTFPVSFTTLESTTVTQTIELTEGWNWFSTYIELDDPVELLQMLEEGLCDNGVQIESVVDGVNMNVGDGYWAGDLDGTGLLNEHMYLVEVLEDVVVELQGPASNPADHPITLYPEDFSWIGYPCAEEVDVNVALSGLEAEDGDYVENDELGVIYYYGGVWIGDFDTMIPGRGYMYFSNSTEEKTLIFQTGEGTKNKVKQ